MTQRKEIIEKLTDNTFKGLYKWTPFHKYTDDPNNPYMYHQHFVPMLSYSLKIPNGTFYLITFRVMTSYPTYAEQICLDFVSTDKQERIDGNSSELLELRKTIDQTFLLREKSSNEESSLSTQLIDFLNE